MKYIRFFPDGSKEWYQYSEFARSYIFHRIGGPAAEYVNGSKYWYQEGKLHRVDGPAIEFSDGTKCWYQNDQLHRLDGPAIEWANGNKKWYYEDTEINCTTQQEFIRLINLKAFW